MKRLLFLFFAFLTLPTFAQLTATVPLVGKVVSKAADATTITAKWSVVSGSGTIADQNSLSTTIVVPIGVTVVQLVGTDNFGTASAPAYKKITVIRNNVPPVMDAGQDTTIQLGQSTTYMPNLISNIRVVANNSKTVNTIWQGDLMITVEDLK